MAKEKVWCDWGDLYKGKVGQPEDPKSKPLDYIGSTLKKGERPRTPSNEEIAKAILYGAPKQPTDEEMFGALVVSQEQVDKAKADFDNKIVDFYKEVTKPLTGETHVDDKEWGSGKSFNSMLSKSEIAKRNMHLDE